MPSTPSSAPSRRMLSASDPSRSMSAIAASRIRSRLNPRLGRLGLAGEQPLGPLALRTLHCKNRGSMSRSELVARLLSEMSAARAAIADSYQRLWATAEQAPGTPAPGDRDQPQPPPTRLGRTCRTMTPQRGPSFLDALPAC